MFYGLTCLFVPCLLRPRWRGFPWNWVSALRIKNLEWWAYRSEQEVWRYLQPHGYNAPTWQTDGRTDRHRTTAAKTALTRVITQSMQYCNEICSLFVSLHSQSYWFAFSINIFSKVLSLSLFRREVAMSLTLLNSHSTAADDIRDVLYLMKTVWTAWYDCKLDSDVLPSER